MLRGWLKRLQDSADLENRRVILRLLEPTRDARLLDLGCGDGDFTLELGQKISAVELCGIEIVDKSIQQCQAKGIKAYYGDLNEPLPLDSDSFDVVIANQVFEHLHHTDLFIREIHRVLRPEAIAVISTPNLAAWHNIVSLFCGWQPFSTGISDEINVGNPLHTNYRRKAAGGIYPTHRRVPAHRGLRELLQYHKFKVENIVGVGYYPSCGRVARLLSYLDPWHSVYLTIKVRKL